MKLKVCRGFHSHTAEQHQSASLVLLMGEWRPGIPTRTHPGARASEHELRMQQYALKGLRSMHSMIRWSDKLMLLL